MEIKRYIIEPITLWTAAQAIFAVAVPLGLYVIARMRSADIKAIEEIEKRMEQLYTSVQAKLDKSEHQRSLDRIYQDISDLRTDTTQGRAEIRQDIKDLRTDLMAAIRDAISK